MAKGVRWHHERHESPDYAVALASLQARLPPLPIGCSVGSIRPDPTSAMLTQQARMPVKSALQGEPQRKLLPPGNLKARP